MSEASLLARLHDRPGALERAIGLIRRRAHGIHRISIASARDAASADATDDATDSELEEPPHSEPRPGARRRSPAVSHPPTAAAKDQAIIELVLRVDESRTPRDRVRRDLLALEDLIDVRDLDRDAAETRELLLAWIRSDAAPQTAGNGRIVAVDGANSLLEMTGTPAEIDTVLVRLDEIDAVITTVRSGEVAAPVIGPG